MPCPPFQKAVATRAKNSPVLVDWRLHAALGAAFCPDRTDIPLTYDRGELGNHESTQEPRAPGRLLARPRRNLRKSLACHLRSATGSQPATGEGSSEVFGARRLFFWIQ